MRDRAGTSESPEDYLAEGLSSSRDTFNTQGLLPPQNSGNWWLLS